MIVEAASDRAYSERNSPAPSSESHICVSLGPQSLKVSSLGRSSRSLRPSNQCPAADDSDVISEVVRFHWQDAI